MASDKELEQQLMEAGNKLLDPPSSLDELLPLLDQIESCLSKVEQSPTKSMQNALAPSLKALVADQLFKHSDVDVQAAVASCISEITRITAPDAPYDDDKMKDVFQLIVSSFQNLSDKSSRSYSKRTSILDTVAKVRSCVVMLDLECDGLIIEMFQHFLSAIRDHHPENVFTAMETIMALVLEESEDISAELLSPLLAALKKRNEEVLPIGRKLGEKVLQNCANKVRPYLQQAMKSSGVSSEDYSDVVASICQEPVEQNDAHAADQNKVEESKPVEASSDVAAQDGDETAAEGGSPKLSEQTNDKSPKSIVSNGVAESCEDESLVDPCSLKKQDTSSQADQSKSVDTSSNADPNSLGAEKLVHDESKPEEASKERKADSSKKLSEPSEISLNDTEKDVQKPLDDKVVGKDIPSSPHEETVVEAAVSSENKKEAGASQPSSPKALEGESVTVASPSESENLSKAAGAKKESLIKDSEPSTDDVTRKTSEGVIDSEAKVNKRSKKETSSKDSEPSEEDVSKKTSEGASDSEAKVNKRSKKESLIKDSEPSAENVSKKTSEGISDSEAKLNKRTKKESLIKDSEPSAGDFSIKTSEGMNDTDAKLNKKSKKETSVKDSDGVSDSEKKVNKRLKKESSIKDSKPSADDVSRKSSEGTSDSEAKLNKRSKKESLTRDSEPSADDVSRKTSEGISDSEAKPNKRSKKEISIKVSEPSANNVSRKTSEGTSDSEAKSKQRSSRKTPGKKSNEEKTPKTDASKKESGATSESETKPLKKPSKKVDVSSNNGDGSSFTPVENKKQRSRGKSVSEKHVSKSSIKDGDKVSSPKSAAKTKDVHQLETTKTDSKRKRAAGNEKGSETPNDDAEDMVGKRVQVYWPKDKEYYIGTIHSYNASSKKHKVLYDDGDEEILNLKREKWAFVKDDGVQDKMEEDVPPSPDAPPETPPPKKKSKTSIDQSAKHGKAESVKGGGASSSKSKSATTKSNQKSKEAGKTEGKSMDDLKSAKKVENENVGKTKDTANKSGSKSAEVASKTGSKSKNEDVSTSKSSKLKNDGAKTPKTSKQESTKSGKPKQDTPNNASNAKSSGKTSKSSGKSSVNNGAGKLKSGSSSKAKEPVDDRDSTDSDTPLETTKLKSLSASKGHGSEGRIGKKRRRA